MSCHLRTLWTVAWLSLTTLSVAKPGVIPGSHATPKVSDWKRGAKLAITSERTFQLAAGTQLKADAGTELEVQSKIPLPTPIASLGPFADSARLLKGRLDVAIDAKLAPANAVLVYGPRRITVLASGGRVSIIATELGVAVGVYEGRDAAVGIGSTWKQVSAGHMMVVSAEHPTGLQSLLPTAPKGLRVARPVLAVPGLSDPTQAEWDPVAEAKNYRVTLVDPKGAGGRSLETTKPELQLTDLNPGRYELRVAALGAFGLTGAYSETAHVNVVGVESPPGGFMSGGRVFIEPGQQLRLTNIEGLEMSYDSAPVYFKAVERTGLRNGRATILRLRVPGSTERASIELYPRSLDTKIDLSPATARWPRDKIRIQVQLPKALAQSNSVVLTPTVTVNGQPITLEWIRTSDAMETAILAPPVYPGPWVLRAQVTDQQGYVLGRNFLEIASMAGESPEDLPVQIHRNPTLIVTKPQ